MNTRAEWALDESRDVIASEDGANWTICMDAEVRLKEAIQSRTVFLTAVDSLDDVVPLISPRVQTVGVAFGDAESAEAFASAATLAGAVRCVRPGSHERPGVALGRETAHQPTRALGNAQAMTPGAEGTCR